MKAPDAYRVRQLALAAAIALSGCMNSPKDGDVVASRSTPIAYGAFVNRETGTVWFQAASAFDARGTPTQWETVWTGDVATSGRFFATDSEGVSWWTMQAEVPLRTRNWWTPPILVGSNRHRAAIRTLYRLVPSGGQFPLQNFNAGPETDTCIEEQIRAGHGGDAIMTECSRYGFGDHVHVWASGD